MHFRRLEKLLVDEQKLTRLLLPLDGYFHAIPLFVSLGAWGSPLHLDSSQTADTQTFPLLPQRGGEETKITQHKKKGEKPVVWPGRARSRRPADTKP